MNRRGRLVKGLVAGVVVAAGLSALFWLGFERTIRVEGGYSNHPDDLGGETMWGVTEQVARAWGYDGAMAALPETTAAAIYHAGYWAPLRLDEVGAVYEDLALLLFDVGFNVGTGRAAGWLQRCLNVNNGGGRRYGDVAVDGHIGPETLAALGRYAELRGDAGEAMLLACVQGLQVTHYVAISEARVQNETFTYGWLRRTTR